MEEAKVEKGATSTSEMGGLGAGHKQRHAQNGKMTKKPTKTTIISTKYR